MKIDVKKIIPHIAALAIFLGISMIYFYPQLQGKEISASDIQQFKAMAQESFSYQDRTGETVLWTGSMFGGMPTFQLTSPQKNNLLRYIEKTMYLGFGRPISYFIMGMICFYILLLAFKVNPWLSIIGAVMFAFLTGNIILFDTGHATKIRAIFLSPPIIAGMYYVFKNKLLNGFVLFTLFLGLSIQSNHPQMTYYLGLVMLIYVIIHSVQSIRSGAYVNLVKQGSVLLIGCILAVGASSSKLWTTYEYGKSTMRGAPILEKQANEAATSSNTDGLEWEYAMNWSNGTVDLLQSFIPLSVGGSSQEVLDDDSPLIKRIPQYKNQPFPLYWGDLTSTSGPYYFGALIFLLFIFGAIVVKGELKWWLIAGVVFTFLISLGKNFEVLNRLLFDYFPLFNKFRTPNSVLTVTGIFIPILAILGLQKLITDEDRAKYTKPLMYAAGSLGGICLLLVLLGGSLFNFSGNYDSSMGELVGLLKETRKEYLTSSSLRSLGFILLGSASIYGFIKNKLNTTLFLGILGVVSILDIMVINKRYLNEGDFKSKRTVNQEFQPRPVDDQIKTDQDPHFRVFDVEQFSAATPSYHHKTIGGYHPAKLQRYQDIIDRHIARNNQRVLNMLNTKYIIFSDGSGGQQVQRNPNALGNAWLVRNIDMVNTANEEIDALNTIDVGSTAAVHQEYQSYVTSNQFSGEGNIQLTEYTPNELTYSFNAATEQFAVFSEVWYHPGWNAYIDGVKADHIRVNYILRGLKVPAGNHEIVFKFEPRSYYVGETLSLISSLIILLGLILTIVRWFKPGFLSRSGVVDN